MSLAENPLDDSRISVRNKRVKFGEKGYAKKVIYQAIAVAFATVALVLVLTLIKDILSDLY